MLAPSFIDLVSKYLPLITVSVYVSNWFLDIIDLLPDRLQVLLGQGLF